MTIFLLCMSIVLNFALAFGVILWKKAVQSLLYYMYAKGYAWPSDEESKECTRQAWLYGKNAWRGQKG